MPSTSVEDGLLCSLENAVLLLFTWVGFFRNMAQGSKSHGLQGHAIK